jgi:hypothetical protein
MPEICFSEAIIQSGLKKPIVWMAPPGTGPAWGKKKARPGFPRGGPYFSGAYFGAWSFRCRFRG